MLFKRCLKTIKINHTLTTVPYLALVSVAANHSPNEVLAVCTEGGLLEELWYEHVILELDHVLLPERSPPPQATADPRPPGRVRDSTSTARFLLDSTSISSKNVEGVFYDERLWNVACRYVANVACHE